MIFKNCLSFLFNLVKYRYFYFETKFFCALYRIEKTILSKEIEESKKIIIYGFGPYGESYFVNLFGKCRIVGLYDRNFELMENHVENPDLIDNIDFDYVIITVMAYSVRNSILDYLVAKGIPKEKVVFVDYVE